MKSPKVHLRDLFWLVLVAAMGLAWRREFDSHQELRVQFAYSQSVAQELAEITNIKMRPTKDGDYEFIPSGTSLVPCPACGGKVGIESDYDLIDGKKPRRMYICCDCRTHFACVLTPGASEGYWLPVADLPKFESLHEPSVKNP